MSIPKLYNEKKCAECGKVIFPTPEWVFKVTNAGKVVKYFCKYSCKKRYEERREAAKMARRKVKSDDKN